MEKRSDPSGKLYDIQILIAEDEDATYRLTERILQKEGAQCLRANNGVEAVEIALGHPDIPIILMDIKMPVMNGVAATKSIKAHKPEIKIVATSAFAMPGDKKVYEEAGCDDFILKPIDATALVDVILAQL